MRCPTSPVASGARRDVQPVGDGGLLKPTLQCPGKQGDVMLLDADAITVALLEVDRAKDGGGLGRAQVLDLRLTGTLPPARRGNLPDR